MLDKGSIDVVRLYLRWGNWEKELEYMDLPSEYGIHAMLEDLGLDPEELEPNSYVEVLRSEGKDKDLRDQGSPNFYSGTAFASRREQQKEVKIVRVYRVPKKPRKAEFAIDSTTEGIEGEELVSWYSGVQASGEAEVKWSV